MNAEALCFPPRSGRLLIAGIGVAFAWLLLTVVLGFGSAEAHADDTDDRGAVGGLVSSVVDETTSTVTDAAAAVLGTVQTIVTVERVPAPVAPVVAPVVQTVDATRGAVTGAVEQVSGGGVVASVVSPVAHVVVEVPVVGGVVSGLGLDEALPAVGGSVDRALQHIVAELGDTIDAVTPSGAATPGVPGIPEPAGRDAGSATGGVLVAAALTATGSDSSNSDVVASPNLAVAASALFSPPVARADAPMTGDTPPPFGPAVPNDAASMGSAGAGPGALGVLALGPLVAHRAWVRRTGREDDHAPAAPTFATDVSPD